MQPHSRKKTGTKIIIGTSSVRYLRTVERESELDKALGEIKFDITELSKIKKLGEAIIRNK
jgi:S-adenosylmethionine:tRNA-ribosyltransferase-isomerase (queuine synthetase)